MPKKVTPRGKAASQPKTAKKPAAKKAAPKRKRAPADKTRFARNLFPHIAGGVRILLENGRVLKLEPRGQINDMAAVDEDDRIDAKYIANYNVLFEEISAAEARKIMEKQNTNAQSPRNRQSSVIDHIVDEYGNPMKQVTIEESFESQGQTVATIEDGPAGRFTDGYQGKITRAPGEAPQQVAVPGSVESPAPEVPSHIPPEQAADFVARQAKQPGAAADQIRDSLDVKVAPAQKERR